MGSLLLPALALQQVDTYVHLGLNRRLSDGTPLKALGPGTWLSYLRGTLAYWLLASLGAGLDSSRLAPVVLAMGTLTDLIDGPIARKLGQATKLGAYIDGESDLMLAVALTRAGVRNGSLPASATWLPVARYALPIGMALRSAFAGGRPAALEHTLLGKLCGVAQTALFVRALAPRRSGQHPIKPRMLFVTSATLSMASGVEQARRIARQDVRTCKGE